LHLTREREPRQTEGIPSYREKKREGEKEINVETVKSVAKSKKETRNVTKRLKEREEK